MLGVVQILVLAMFASWGFAHAVTERRENWRLFYVIFTALAVAVVFYRVVRYRQRFKPLF